MAKSQRQTKLDINQARVTAILAQNVPGLVGVKQEIGRGAPDTRVMQGTTQEVVPDRTLSDRNDDGS